MFRRASSFNGDLSEWHVSKVSGMTNIYEGTGFSSCTKDKIAWKWGDPNTGTSAFRAAYPNFFEDWRTGECAPCPGGLWCAGSAMTPCDAGYWCPEGTSKTEDQRPCPNGKYGNLLEAGASVGYALEETACGMCPPGRRGNGRAAVGNQTVCQPCEDGRWSAFGAPACYLRCTELGQYWDGLQCVPSPPGTELSTLGGTDASSCTACADGFVAPENGTANCQRCGQGTHSNRKHTACLPCGDGTVSLGGVTTCTPCQAGTLANSDRSYCQACNPGSVPVGLSCEECSPGFSAEFGASECALCPEGAIAPSPKTTFCTVCPQGYYASGDHTQCLVCEAGSQCSTGIKTLCATGTSDEGSSSCADCGAGTFLNQAAEPPTCDACKAGFVSKAAASSCTPCGRGTYQHGTDCRACPIGRYGSEVGLSSCSDLCPPGTHAPRYSTACKACEPGRHSAAFGQEWCTRCGDFMVSPPNASQCVCLDGFSNETAFDGNGTASMICAYVQSDTAPIFIGAAGGFVLVVLGAAFALRGTKGGLAGAVQRLLTNGFAVGASKVSLGLADIFTDAMAVVDVLGNPALASFHTTFATAFAFATITSIYVVARLLAIMRRRWRVDAAAVVPAAKSRGSSAGLAEAARPGVRAALESHAGDESKETDIVECIKEAADSAERDRLAAERAEIDEDTEDSELTLVALSGEDVPMGVVTLWLMLAYIHEISAVLLVSFAFNCMLLGFKMTHVFKLAKTKARKLKASRAAAALALAEEARTEVRRQSALLLAVAEEADDDGASSAMGGEGGAPSSAEEKKVVDELARLRSQNAEIIATLAEKNSEIAALKAQGTATAAATTAADQRAE